MYRVAFRILEWLSEILAGNKRVLSRATTEKLAGSDAGIRSTRHKTVGQDSARMTELRDEGDRTKERLDRRRRPKSESHNELPNTGKGP